MRGLLDYSEQIATRFTEMRILPEALKRPLSYRMHGDGPLCLRSAPSVLARILLAVVVGFAAPVVFRPCAYADDEDNAFTIGEAGGYLIGELSVSKKAYKERRFLDPAGHAFAAEEGNNFIDRLKGLDARVVGENNEKNGPDRMIVNRDGSTTWIQDKYYQNVRDAIGVELQIVVASFGRII